MLAETSRTITVLASCESATTLCVAGCRDTTRNATVAPIATAASVRAVVDGDSRYDGGPGDVSAAKRGEDRARSFAVTRLRRRRNGQAAVAVGPGSTDTRTRGSVIRGTRQASLRHARRCSI